MAMALRSARYFLLKFMPKAKIDFLILAFVIVVKLSSKSNAVQLWSNEVYYM